MAVPVLGLVVTVTAVVVICLVVAVIAVVVFGVIAAVIAVVVFGVIAAVIAAVVIGVIFTVIAVVVLGPVGVADGALAGVLPRPALHRHSLHLLPGDKRILSSPCLCYHCSATASSCSRRPRRYAAFLCVCSQATDCAPPSLSPSPVLGRLRSCAFANT